MSMLHSQHAKPNLNELVLAVTTLTRFSTVKVIESDYLFGAQA
jgi:hypothetical protein